jgi:hypothetical protein
MQFVYRLGAVVFGTTTFLVAYAIGVMVWFSHLWPQRTSTANLLLNWLPHMSWAVPYCWWSPWRHLPPASS